MYSNTTTNTVFWEKNLITDTYTEYRWILYNAFCIFRRKQNRKLRKVEQQCLKGEPNNLSYFRNLVYFCIIIAPLWRAWHAYFCEVLYFRIEYDIIGRIILPILIPDIGPKHLQYDYLLVVHSKMRLIVVLLKVRLIFSKFSFAFLDDLGNFKHFEPYLFSLRKNSRTFKSTTNRRTFNRCTVDVQAHCPNNVSI